VRYLDALRREPLPALAREACWRAYKQWKKMDLSHRLRQPWRVAFRNIPYYRPDLQKVSRETRDVIVAFADEIRAGRFPFLSYDTAGLGMAPKWNLDFVCGAEWPYIRYEGRECVRHDGSDVKVPYELSRLQFLPVLGKAHLLKGDNSYRHAAKDLLTHWIESNPPAVGVNWTIAMEAALRGMSICFLLNLLAPFGPNDEAWLATVTRSLADHVLYIEAHLEFSYLSSSNHYLSDVVGLYCLFLFLDGEGMQGRRHRYRQSIESEMMRQVYEDGGDYEASTGYHVLVTQLFTTALLLMRAEGARPASTFIERLKLMFRFLNAVASPSGQVPHVGDCDDGRVELLNDDLRQMMLLPVAERNSLRVSNLLGLGQQLLGEGAGQADDAAWFGLAGSVRAPQLGTPSLPPAVAVSPKSGIAIVRTQSAELLFLAIPNGISGRGSHTHNDKLSFVLRVGGEEILCDSGTGCYTRDAAIRNRFRRTAAHNTLVVDGKEQNRFDAGPHGIFSLGNEAVVTPIEWGTEPGGYFLRASHNGYHSLGATHARSIHVREREEALVIEDMVDGFGIHDLEINFQVAPPYTPTVEPHANRVRCHVVRNGDVQLIIDGPDDWDCEVRPSLVSTIYGSTTPATNVRFRACVAVPRRVTTYISWAHVSTLMPKVTHNKKEPSLAYEGLKRLTTRMNQSAFGEHERKVLARSTRGAASL